MNTAQQIAYPEEKRRAALRAEWGARDKIIWIKQSVFALPLTHHLHDLLFVVKEFDEAEAVRRGRLCDPGAVHEREAGSY
jgi:hypothetical protein